MTANPFRDDAVVFSAANIVEQVRAVAGARSAAPALVATAERAPTGYRDLLQLADSLAGELLRAGLSPGDRVALRARSDAAFVIALLAALSARLVAVPLDPGLPAADQRARLSAAGVRAVLVDPGATADATPPSWPVTVTPASVDLAVTAAAPPPAPPPPDGLRDDDAVIMFTGGTTGAPKMVPWTHDNIAASVSAVIATYRLGPADATVAAMPLFHGHGLIAALLSTLASGGTVLLPAAGSFSARTFTDDIAAAAATWLTAVPTIYRILLARKPSHRSGMRFIRSCSAALDPPTARALRDVFAAPVLCAYGMTEATHQVTSMRLDDRGAVTSGLVGRSSGAQIAVVDADGRSCPHDTVGEVWLRGRTVVRGYLANPAATAQNFTDGWLHTGDLGSLSAAGALTLVGRIKELINRGGEKISPERVEEVLAGHPDVAEVAVFGVPDSIYGETVAAAVVPRAAASPSAAGLAAFCRDQLAPFEIPTRVRLTEQLPHTAKGSVDRRAVAHSFEGGESTWPHH